MNSNFLALISQKSIHYNPKKRKSPITKTETDSNDKQSEVVKQDIDLYSNAIGEETNILAIDCEMVGVEEESALARCSVVNYHGEIVYDKFVKPKQRVTDFRTKVSGITPLCLKNAITEKVALEEIHKLLEGKVLVGHTINQDLKVLKIQHPKGLIRDLAYYKPLCKDRPIALKTLAKEELNLEIQKEHHDSVVDARIALMIYRKFENAWEEKKIENREKFEQREKLEFKKSKITKK